MNTLRFSRITIKNKNLIYVRQNKQLYQKSKINNVYKCQSKNCKSKILLQGETCVFKSFLHNHYNNAQSKYFQMKSWEKIDKMIQKNEYKIMNSRIKPSEIFEQARRTYKNFNLVYKKHYQLIWKRMRKIKNKLVHQNKGQNIKISLNALAKKLLVVDKKYEHLLNTTQTERENNVDIKDFENKILCKICFDNEANIRLDPCGHILCEKCVNMMLEMKRTKLREENNSERIIERKLKINCFKCRTIIQKRDKIFY